MSLRSMTFRRLPTSAVRCFILVVVCVPSVEHSPAETAPNGQGLKPVLDYISAAWDTLTRAMTECQSIVDPKINAAPVLYLPAVFAEPPMVQKLAAESHVHV